MKFLIILFLWILSLNSTVEDLRTDYIKAIDSKVTTEKRIEYFKENKPTTPIQRCYNGVFHCLNAKHAFLPNDKISYLKKGLSDINKSVVQAPNDLEIRFHRFAIEQSIPSFISFTSHIKVDKKFIVDNYSSTHPFSNVILKYMITKGGCAKTDFKNK
jgi:hypothetical protein